MPMQRKKIAERKHLINSFTNEAFMGLPTGYICTLKKIDIFREAIFRFFFFFALKHVGGHVFCFYRDSHPSLWAQYYHIQDDK